MNIQQTDIFYNIKCTKYASHAQVKTIHLCFNSAREGFKVSN